MPDFMRKHRFQFRLGKLGYQCVEQDDFAKMSEPGEESIGVMRPLAAVHYFDAAGWKICAPRQGEETLAQRALRQRREFVEKWHDHRRGDQQQNQLEHDHDYRCPNPPV